MILTTDKEFESFKDYLIAEHKGGHWSIEEIVDEVAMEASNLSYAEGYDDGVKAERIVLNEGIFEIKKGLGILEG